MTSGDHDVVRAVLASMERATCTRAKLGFGTFFTCLFERDGVETAFLWVYMGAWEIRCPATDAVLASDLDVEHDSTRVGDVLQERFEGARVIAFEPRPCSIRWRSTTGVETDLQVWPFRKRAADVLLMWYLRDVVYSLHPSGLASLELR